MPGNVNAARAGRLCHGRPMRGRRGRGTVAPMSLRVGRRAAWVLGLGWATVAGAAGPMTFPTTGPTPVPGVAGPLAAVNVMQGTDSTGAFSHGNTLPMVGTPWAMTDWSVQNAGDEDTRWYYQSFNTRFVGFRATHLPCPWSQDWGDFTLTPQTGPVAVAANARGCHYDPASTVLRPDYDRVRLDKYHLTAELTASERCAVLRLTFDPGQAVGRVIIDPGGECELSAHDDRFAGYTKRHQDQAAGDFHCYFAAQLDRPITGSVGIADKGPRLGRGSHGRQVDGPNLGGGPGYVEFDVSRNPVVQIRVATSFISPAQARQTLATETAGGFDGVRQRTAAAWNQQLSRITLGGATDAQRATFYSCLYRAMKFPRKLYEIDAAGRPTHYSPWDGKVHPGVAYTDSGLWDTYRTQFPFLSIAYPEQLGEIVAGWLNAYREGGWLPQWPNPGGFRGMTGSHADVMVADAMGKHIGGFDYAVAYRALHHDAFDVPPPGGNAGGRAGMADYLRLGYLPARSTAYWVSTSLDYAYDDWACAQAAKLTHHDGDYRTLMARSMNYRKSWDPAVGFMRGRSADGAWADKRFDPYAWGGGYTESSPWQASWAVQHDTAGLADLTGGRAAFAGVLDHLFHQPSRFHVGGYGGVIHEMTEFATAGMGQFEPNNQPGFHLPYLYAAAGQPWKADPWTRRTCAELYGAGPDGFCGDEDNGSTSSWYLLNALGLYPLTPGQPSYVFASPLFPSVTVALPLGKTFTVLAPGNADRNVYVTSRTLNGQPDTNTWITQQQIADGGTVVATMGDHPAERTVAAAELPYSAKAEMAAAGIAVPTTAPSAVPATLPTTAP